MEQEKNILIAKRVPPGDRWSLLNEDEVHNSLTETLEAYYQQTDIKPKAFRLEPLKGELYAITIDCAVVYAKFVPITIVPALPNVNVLVDTVAYLSPEYPELPAVPECPVDDPGRRCPADQ